MIHIFDKEYITAKKLLSSTGLNILDAARLIVEATETCGHSIKRIREIIRLGAKELEKREKTVCFQEAVQAKLNNQRSLRPRTLSDIRQITNRLMRDNPELADMPLRTITSDHCRHIIERAYSTERQKYKARAVIGGIFAMGRKRGWCADNPIRMLDVPVIDEAEIRALKLIEVQKIFVSSLQVDEGSGTVAIGMMLYAGIRPQEVKRLSWRDISLENEVITLRPCHTKTGGARHVSIAPILMNLIKMYQKINNPMANDSVCPRGWKHKWQKIRHLAGWTKNTWQQDCLRHTFASYHVKYHRNYNLLQQEMGHSSLNLLRTRYINMEGITTSLALLFWNDHHDPAYVIKQQGERQLEVNPKAFLVEMPSPAADG